MRTVLSAGVSVLALFVSTPGLAQQQSEATTVEEVVVTGQRATQQRAIDRQRAATGLTSVAAADEIGNLPDRNVAEVIERLPGVGVQYDQGEGRYVSVRGVPSDLNNYTINGFEIGNPDGNTRRLPLDIVSGQLLNRVEVAKVKTAGQDGQGIGGNINLVTQTAFDFRSDRFFQVSAQAGYQTLNEESPIRGDVSLGGRFGDFGVMVGASYSDREFASAGLYPDDWTPFTGAARGALPINVKFTDYRLTRERIGAIASLDWRPDGPTSLFLRALYSRFTEDEYRQRYRLDFATPALRTAGAVRLNSDGLSGTTTGATEIRQDLRLEYKEKSVLSVQAGGRTQLQDWTLDYGIAGAHNEVIEPNQLWQFRASPGTVDFDFTDELFTATPRTPVTAAMLGFRQYAEQDENGDEDIVSARFDARRPLDMFDGAELSLGLKYRSTDKSFDSGNAIWDRGATAATRFVLSVDPSLVGPSVTVEPRDGRLYTINPTLSAQGLIAYTRANLAGPFFVRNTASTLANATLADTDVGEDVAAAYLTADITVGGWTFTPGLRVEQTELDITGFRLVNGTSVVPASESQSYTDWLPSLIARWEPNEDVVVRLAYSRSLGRPNYLDLSPGGTNTFVDNGDGTFDGGLSMGNAQLDPYRADAFDASAEWYFAPGGLLSAGVFAKTIDNPIYTRSETRRGVAFGGRNYRTLTFSQKDNADSADLYGLELAWRQQFDFLPGLWSGLGVDANLTLIDGSLDLPGRSGVSFPEQSDTLYGVQIFYQYGPVEASIAYHSTGSALLALGADTTTDQYNDELRRLDAKATFAVTDNASIFFEAQNLTDEPTRQYQGGHEDWITQNERYGRVFNAGMTVKW
jgi:TonB-dependent receptor